MLPRADQIRRELFALAPVIFLVPPPSLSRSPASPAHVSNRCENEDGCPQSRRAGDCGNPSRPPAIANPGERCRAIRQLAGLQLEGTCKRHTHGDTRRDLCPRDRRTMASLHVGDERRRPSPYACAACDWVLDSNSRARSAVPGFFSISNSSRSCPGQVPACVHRHGHALVKPSWQRLATCPCRERKVRHLVTEDRLDRIVGIRQHTLRKDRDVLLACRQADGPLWDGTRAGIVFRYQNHTDAGRQCEPCTA